MFAGLGSCDVCRGLGFDEQCAWCVERLGVLALDVHGHHPCLLQWWQTLFCVQCRLVLQGRDSRCASAACWSVLMLAGKLVQPYMACSAVTRACLVRLHVSPGAAGCHSASCTHMARRDSQQAHQTLDYVVGANCVHSPRALTKRAAVLAGKHAMRILVHMRRELSRDQPSTCQHLHKTRVMRLSPMRHGKMSCLAMTCCQPHVLRPQLLLHTPSEHQAHPRGRHPGHLGAPSPANTAPPWSGPLCAAPRALAPSATAPQAHPIRAGS